MRKIKHKIAYFTVVKVKDIAGHSDDHIGEVFSILESEVESTLVSCGRSCSVYERCEGMIKPPWFSHKVCWYYRTSSHLKRMHNK